MTGISTTGQAISHKAKILLSRATIVGGDALRLNGRPTHSAQREAANVIKALGFAWDDDRHLWTISDVDPRALLDTALVVGHVVGEPHTFDLFATPEALAAKLVKAARISESDRVLEPSAGGGSILRLLPARTEFCELRTGQYGRLKKDRGEDRAITTDLFDVPTARQFDRIIAAPPLSNNQDIHHVMRLLKLAAPGGRLVVLMTAHTQYRDDRLGGELLEDLGAHSQWSLSPLSATAITGKKLRPSVCVLIADIKKDRPVRYE